jgi:tellurium resistance protein TerD
MGSIVDKVIVKIQYALKNDSKKLLTQNTNAFVFVLNSRNKLLSDKYLIYYNNTKTPDNSLDLFENRTSQKKYMESIKLDFSKIDKNAKRIRFFISLYKAEENRLNFNDITDLSISFIDQLTKEEIAVYKPETFFIDKNFIALAEFTFDTDWEIEAIGEGYKSDFNEFISNMFEDENEKAKNISDSEFEDWCYKTLECTKNSTNDEIKTKYKSLVKSFHPDVIQSSNLHKDFVEFARTRFMDLKKAYEYLKKTKNIK